MAEDSPSLDTARDDRHLAARIRRGDTAALDELADRYLDGVYRFVLYRVDCRKEDAESIVQDTMVAAIRSIRDFRGASSMYSWICGIAKRKIADFLARRQRKARMEIAMSSADSTLLRALEGIETDSLAEDLLERREVRQLVGAALSSISPTYALALRRRYMEGVSVQQVAEDIGRSYKAAESLLRHARDAFRAAFATIGKSYIESA